MAANYDVLSPLDFLSDVVEEAKNAKHRFWAQAMDVEGGKTADKLFDSITTAAKRGIDTRFHADYHSLLITDTVFNYMPTFSRKWSVERKRRLKNRYELLHELQKNGVDVTLLNKPGYFNQLLPTFGRNHMKMIIVDDIVWIGGVNFHEGGFYYTDLMVKFTLPQMVQAISDLFLNIDKKKRFDDYKQKIDEEQTLFVDSGSRQSSIILEHARDLIRQAKDSIKMTSVFFPDGKLLRLLHEKYKKGLNVQVVTPELPLFIGYPRIINPLSQKMMYLTGQTIPIRYYPKIIHAKLLIVDDKEAIFGSHNFTEKGVRMQTGELALRTANKHLVHNLVNFYHNL